jgi:phosphatidate cytidylyltransferase
MILWGLLFMEVMRSGMKLPFEKVSACFVGGILLPLLLGSLVRIHALEQGRALVLVPFAVAFLSDSGAYFVGLKFGKHKLAPTISPKKTVEGMLGGILGAVVGLGIFCLVLQLFFGFTINYLYVLVYGLVGSLGGVFGDLCFSAIKRQTGIKDYGNLIPGHGGILDRFDSMIVIGPLVEALLLLLPLAVK